jgi:thymidylate kinase
VLGTLARLLERLDTAGIGYCHWKSNWVLEQSLAGETDVDLLVERDAARSFRGVLGELGFRPAVEPGAAPFPSVEHYHALDEESGELVHVHAYFRVITGDSLGKNYRLPVEGMLLDGDRRIGGVRVPSRAAELVIFVLRMSLKHASLVELALVTRKRDEVAAEAEWLIAEDVRAETLDLVRTWLPAVDVGRFEAAMEGLLAPAPLWRRVVRGRRLRAELRPFARHGRLRAGWTGVRSFAARSARRVRGSRTKLAPSAGGAVVAFVGAEASGKSTMLEAVEGWLGAHFTVRRIHAGKPPSTALTFAPNRLLPVFRTLLPGQRSTTVSARLVSAGDRAEATPGPFPLLFGLRSVLLAHDRRALLLRAFASSANGEIVLCDRYPSVDEGALDGPQLRLADPEGAGRLRRRLAGIEARLYRDVPPADLVIRLTAPLDVTLARNRSRSKSEPEEYVLSRHARSTRLEFERVRVESVNTDRPLEETLRDVRRLVWESL